MSVVGLQAGATLQAILRAALAVLAVRTRLTRVRTDARRGLNDSIEQRRGDDRGE